MRVEGEMRLRAAGPHFCACVRSFRGCALRGARHEAPSLRLLCVIGLSRVRNEKEFRAATARSNRVVAMVQHPHTLRCNWHTTHICKRPKTRETLSILYGVRRGGTHAARVTTARSLRVAGAAHLWRSRDGSSTRLPAAARRACSLRGKGGRRGLPRPLGGPAWRSRRGRC